MVIANKTSEQTEKFINQKELLGQEEEFCSRQLMGEIIGEAKSWRQILTSVAKIARSPSSVLILGESGTGKELIASAIHRLSQRANANFVAINCSAIPEELLEAELFGHEKVLLQEQIEKEKASSLKPIREVYS